MTAPTLVDFDFDLGGIGLGFGGGHDIIVEKVDYGTTVTRSQDKDAPRGDWRMFGVDYKTPPTWSFDLYTDTTSAASASALMEALAEVWDRDDVRGTPNEVVPLRYRQAGRTRLVYGRPRNFEVLESSGTHRLGRLHAMGDFVLAEARYYEETEQAVPLSLAGSSVGGFVTPWVTPVKSTGAGSVIANQITVGGAAPTWLRFKFSGPATNPYVQVDGSEVRLATVMATGGILKVDTRPWVQAVTHNDGTVLAGLLHPRTRLASMLVAPGQHTVVFGLQSSTGPVTGEVRWQNAYRTR